MKKNVASQTIGAQMVTASDGSAFTSEVKVFITGDNGSQTQGSVSAGVCVHKGTGYHSYAPSQAETNFDHIAFTFAGTGAFPATIQVYTSSPQTGDAFARLGAPAGASVSADVAAVKAETASILTDTGTTLDSKLNTIDTNVDSILSDTGTDGVVVAAGSKTGYALSTAGVDAVLDEVVEGTTTFRQMLRGFAAALLGKLSGAATTTVAARDLGDTKDRISATVDADGNRSAVTLDLT